jgi:hypothetical protein
MMLITASAGQLWIGVPAEAGAGIALTSAGLTVSRPGREPELVEWDQITSARLEAKVSMWRHPRAASWLMNLLAAVLDAWAPGDPPEVRVLVTRPDGTSISAVTPAHFLTGYVRAEVEGVTELLRRAVRDADVRAALANPDQVVAAVQRSVTTGAPLLLGEPACQPHDRG